MSEASVSVLPEDLQRDYLKGKELLRANEFEAASEALGSVLAKAYVRATRVVWEGLKFEIAAGRSKATPHVPLCSLGSLFPVEQL